MSQRIGRGKGITGGETACAEEVKDSSVAKWRGHELFAGAGTAGRWRGPWAGWRGSADGLPSRRWWGTPRFTWGVRGTDSPFRSFLGEGR